ncbi:3'-5' exonuclease [Bosea sp. BIWAKO-01]|uniref:3'-5' exonuclease n=1 Tax=Bosea sp. BIWAKO-01 TaxID=506668 RepID=UPI000852EEC4|nr:3'-5' exonuclease [Bosea sp. BIWAKO-01]GAU86813.1 DNA helicase II [Bosea sp. BIWAKO-01]
MAVGRDSIVAMSSDYAHGNRLDQLIADTIDRAHSLLETGASAADALASFSGDRAVRIMSIHKSKGLEFETVFVLGVEKQSFWGNQDEERSTDFVGISRAKKQLVLTICDQRSPPAGANNWRVHRTPHGEFLGYV